MSATVYPVGTDEQREGAVAAVAAAVSGGRTAIIPTDTVYGIAADAFSRGGVQQLLAAKGRSRRMPPPVLIADAGVLPGLADAPSTEAQKLAEAFWPGPLTLILHAQPSLTWDLGETAGTVALRVPDDSLARAVLKRTGPLAVSSANRTGRPPATTAAEAAEQLGERVQAILDDGVRPPGREDSVTSAEVLPSTIVDCTGERPVMVRQGALSLEQLREVVPEVTTRQQLYDEQRRGSHAEPADIADSEPAITEPETSSEAEEKAELVEADSSGKSFDQLRSPARHSGSQYGDAPQDDSVDSSAQQRAAQRRAQPRVRPLSVDQAQQLVRPTAGEASPMREERPEP